MHRLWASVKKESILLLRDSGALVILFVMPLVLIISITLIQQDTFKTQSRTKIPVLMVDNDKASISEGIKDNLDKSGSFELVYSEGDLMLTEDLAKDLVFKGKYQMAIILPENLSSDLQKKVEYNVDKVLQDVGIGPDSLEVSVNLTNKEIRLYFDPATQFSFKSAVKNSIDKMVSEIEVKSIYTVFQEQLSDSVLVLSEGNFLTFKEIMPAHNTDEIIPNATQHNVPAWTLFAIFFIVIPLSINLVKEKGQGTLVRLRTLPMPYWMVLAGKTITFLIICLIQFYLMVAVGKYLFPHIGLQALQLSAKILWLMSLVAVFSGFAAIGFGILLGTVFSTQEQSAPFGATSVVILAALGGVWVPVFAMPKIMQSIAGLSPLNWGLNAFYDVILRNAGLGEILPELLSLFLFFCLMVAISIYYDQKKRAV